MAVAYPRCPSAIRAARSAQAGDVFELGQGLRLVVPEHHWLHGYTLPAGDRKRLQCAVMKSFRILPFLLVGVAPILLPAGAGAQATIADYQRSIGLRESPRTW